MAKEFDLGTVRGASGPQGPAGPQGAAGPQGPVGPLPHITVGEVLTLPPESAATVTRRENSPDEAPILDFGIPRGSGGGGDMPRTVYDPQNLQQDIFAYAASLAGRRAATLVLAAANSRDSSRADFVCDGVSDQLTIKQALAALPDSGGSLLLLEGDYWLDTAGVSEVNGVLRLIEIDKPNVRLCGAGPATRLRLSADAVTADAACRLLYISAANCSLQALTLDGGSSGPDNLYAVWLGADADGARITSTTLRNCSAGGLYALSDDVLLHGCDLLYCGCGAVLTGNDCRLLANAASYCTTGLLIEGGRCEACANRVLHATSCGIHFSYAVGGALLGNTVIDQPVGIRIQYAQNLLVLGNTVRRSTASSSFSADEHTVSLEDANDCTVLFNRLEGKAAQESGYCFGNLLALSGTDWNITAG